jgi:hypothetical protein
MDERTLLWVGWAAAAVLAMVAVGLYVGWRNAKTEANRLRTDRRVTEAEPKRPAREAPPAVPKRPARSDAVSLLAALQREARFVDLVQESLDQYSDEQVGAAARDVLRGCRAVLDRLFELQPVVPQSEGDTVHVPAGFDTGRWRLTGNVAGEPPFEGRLVHHGWQAKRCQLPQWSGSNDSATVVAAAEVELP